MRMHSLVVVAICLLAGPAFVHGAYVDLHVRLVQSDDNGFTAEFQFDTPTFKLKTYRDGQFVHQVMVDGLGYIQNPGKAMLPVKGLLFGIPGDGQPTFEVQEIDRTVFADNYTLYPSPSYPPSEGKNSGCKNVCGSITEEFSMDPDFYNMNAVFPITTVEQGFSGFIRNQKVSQLLIHPVQYNPAQRQVTFTEKIRIRVDYNSNTAAYHGASGLEDDNLSVVHEEMLRSALINYRETTRWPRTQSAGTIDAPPIGASSGGKGAGDLKISIMEPGVYSITYDDIAATGLDPSLIAPKTFRLLLRGTEIPILVFGEDDDVFDPTDTIVFWAEPLKERSSYAAIYWLTYGGADGLRMTELSGLPSGTAPAPQAFSETMHFEENNHWYPGLPTWETAEIWEWEWITAPESFSAAFDLENLSALPRLATLRVLLHGRTAHTQTPDHHTKLYLNGTEVDDLYWDGQIEFLHEVQVPMDLLIEGENVLTITSPGDTGAYDDVIYLNWFEVDVWKNYQAAGEVFTFYGETSQVTEFSVPGFTSDVLLGFDVTDPQNPMVIEDAVIAGAPGDYSFTFEDDTAAVEKYVVTSPDAMASPYAMDTDDPTDLRNTANGADYIIITDPAFELPVLDLAAHRGIMRVEIVYTEDIYDEFSYGIPDPGAIADFLAYAYASWTAPAVSYVLLVGDTHPDYNDYLNTGKLNHVPSMLIDTPNMGATPSDIPYSLVSGDDLLPDLILGRIPAESEAEAQNMVDKTIAYETGPVEAWQKNVTFTADNNYNVFADHSDQLASYMPGDFTVSKMYLGFTDPEVLRTGINALINQGQLLLNYIGHGGVENWAGESYFTSDDAQAVTNTDKFNFVMSFSCINGYFPIVETRKAITEAFLLPVGAGSIGSLAAVGYTARTDNEVFSEEIYKEIFTSDILETGLAITTAKITAFGTYAVGREIIELYHLLGDPALELRIIPTDGDDDDTGTDDDPAEMAEYEIEEDASSGGDDQSCGEQGGEAGGGCSMVH